MKDLKYYLEMLPVRETRKLMGAYANTDSGTSHEVDVPDWVLEDANWIPDKTSREILGPNVKKGLALALGKFVFDANRVPLRTDGNRIRVVLTPKSVLWGNSKECIHQEIIAYGMCTDKIPMDRALGEYTWSEKKESIPQILCLEYNYRDENPWSFAESYNYDFMSNAIIHFLETSVTYEKVMYKLGIDPEMLVFNEELNIDDVIEVIEI